MTLPDGVEEDTGRLTILRMHEDSDPTAESGGKLRSLTGSVWSFLSADPHAVQTLTTSLKLHSILAHCLVVRGADSPSEAARILEPSLSALHDPFTLHGMDRAVKRLSQAIDGGESMRVVTDYDVDGTTSSLILQATLQILGARDVSYHT